MKSIITTLLFISSLFISLNSNASFCNESGSIISVKKYKTGRTEYVIFTVKKPYLTAPIVTNVTPPFIQDGSGDTISISGCKYKQITFNHVVWTCTIREYLNATSFIKSIKNIGQFEGDISYVIGYKCSRVNFAFYSYDAGKYRKYVMRFRY